MSVDYGRPEVKGRKIFGELVPYGQVWRAGANSSTKLHSDSLLILVEKQFGRNHGLFIIPTEKDWKVILNKDFQCNGELILTTQNRML
ncbi:DUF2911 domain-containing protein [Chryseobacterium indoltheticum]|uniref:DUF2911 domain-containing protein n=1 Tax=Chryseobacterium indoltheticum TaxID=254 RepID=UPI003F492A6F